MRSWFCAGAVIALACLSGCERPPAPPAAPSGRGWRVLAEGAQEITMRTVKTGRNSSMVVLSGDRPNDGLRSSSTTSEDVPPQLVVGRNVSEFRFHPAAASEEP